LGVWHRYIIERISETRRFFISFADSCLEQAAETKAAGDAGNSVAVRAFVRLTRERRERIRETGEVHVRGRDSKKVKRLESRRLRALKGHIVNQRGLG
jgi:hypothetical protein